MTSDHFNIETPGMARAAAPEAMANTFAKFAALGKRRMSAGAAAPALATHPHITEPNEARA
jgi:hypothetical protein